MSSQPTPGRGARGVVKALVFTFAASLLTAGAAFAQITEATTQPPESPKPRFPQLPDDPVDVPSNQVPGAPNTVVSPKEGEFVGRLEKVEGRELSFKENDPEKTEAEVRTVTLAPNGKVTLNREPAQLKDLKPDDFVRVKTTPGDAKIAIEVAAARVIHDTPPQPDPQPMPRTRPMEATGGKLPRAVDQGGGLGLVVTDSPDIGVLILNVNQNTPAWAAGLRIGDFLLNVGGQEIITPADYLTTVRSHAPRETVTLLVWRKGKTLDGDVVLTTAEAADDRIAEDARALILAETQDDKTVIINNPQDPRALTPGIGQTGAVAPGVVAPGVTPGVVAPGVTPGVGTTPGVGQQPTGTDGTIGQGSSGTNGQNVNGQIPGEYNELARQYRLLQQRIQQLEGQNPGGTRGEVGRKTPPPRPMGTPGTTTPPSGTNN